MNAWIYTHLPSTIIRSEHPEDLLVFLDYISHKESTPRLHLALTSLWTYALDVVARLFALPVPNRASADFELPPGATPLSLYMSKSAIDWGKEWASFVQAGRVGNVRRITENHVMKCGGEPHEEVQAISLVSFKTRILVPQARIVEKSTLILDLVSGVPLSRCWDKLGLLSQFRICCTVRTYIRQLRNLPPNEKPGPMTGSVRGALFEHEDIYNVFPTWMRFQCWCEALGSRGWRTLASLARHDSSFGPIKPLPPPCSGTIDFRNLVFTHGDLHLGNLMLDTDGSLWIIDWDDSGYYPVWFESLGMIRYRETLPRSWIRWIWFMAGSYPDAELLWSYVREAIYDRI